MSDRENVHTLVRALRLRAVLGTAGATFELNYPALRLVLQPGEPFPLRVERPRIRIAFDWLPDDAALRAGGFRKADGVPGVVLGPAPEALSSASAGWLEAGMVVVGGTLAWRGLPRPAEVLAVLDWWLGHVESDPVGVGHWMEDLEALERGEAVDVELLMLGANNPLPPTVLTRLRPHLGEETEAWTRLCVELLRGNKTPAAAFELGLLQTQSGRALLEREASSWSFAQRVAMVQDERIRDALHDWCERQWDLLQDELNALPANWDSTQALRLAMVAKCNTLEELLDVLEPLLDLDVEGQTATWSSLVQAADPTLRTSLLTTLIRRTRLMAPTYQLCRIAFVLRDAEAIDGCLRASLEQGKDWTAWSDVLVELLSSINLAADLAVGLSRNVRTNARRELKDAEGWISILARTGEPVVEPELLAWLEVFEDPYTRASIIQVLNTLGTPAALPVLRSYDSVWSHRSVRGAAQDAIEAITVRVAAAAGSLSVADSSGRISTTD